MVLSNEIFIHSKTYISVWRLFPMRATCRVPILWKYLSGMPRTSLLYRISSWEVQYCLIFCKARCTCPETTILIFFLFLARLDLPVCPSPCLLLMAVLPPRPKFWQNTEPEQKLHKCPQCFLNELLALLLLEDRIEGRGRSERRISFSTSFTTSPEQVDRQRQGWDGRCW